MAASRFLIPLFLIVSGLSPESPGNPELLQRTETAFRAALEVRHQPGQARPLFRQAAAGYEQLRARGACNADLYRNEGNAYLLAADLPRAIFAYRCGLRLVPGDRLLQANLDYAREQVVYPSSGIFASAMTSDRPSLLPRLPSRLTLLVSAALYSLGWLGVTRWCMTRRLTLLQWGVAAWVLSVVPVSSLLAEEYILRQESRYPLVVVAEDGVILRIGNGRAYPARFETPLPRGLEGRLLFSRGDWQQIELPGGEVGWVPGTAVLVDFT
jgi:hypothetical protein